MSAERAPLVSVCIANYNGEAFVAECIESVLNQVDAPAFEIIVHDDASTDGSVGIIERYPDVRLLASPENVGFCVSNNRMAAVARGSYLLLLNNDAVLWTDALRTLADSAAHSIDDPILSLPQYDYHSGSLLDRGFLLDPFANPVPVTGSYRGTRAMVMGSCLWISRSLWCTIGGFPTWMESIGEDLYLCCYARLLGHGVHVATQSGYRHRVGSSFGGGKIRNRRMATTIRRRALSERNKTFVLFIFLPLPLLLVIFPLHMALLILEGTILSLWHGNRHLMTRIYMPAIIAAVTTRRELIHIRREAHRTRAAPWRDYLAPVIWTPWKIRLLLRHGLPTIK